LEAIRIGKYLSVQYNLRNIQSTTTSQLKAVEAAVACAQAIKFSNYKDPFQASGDYLSLRQPPPQHIAD
jgi:hypothetical protein